MVQHSTASLSLSRFGSSASPSSARSLGLHSALYIVCRNHGGLSHRDARRAKAGAGSGVSGNSPMRPQSYLFLRCVANFVSNRPTRGPHNYCTAPCALQVRGVLFGIEQLRISSVSLDRSIGGGDCRVHSDPQDPDRALCRAGRGVNFDRAAALQQCQPRSLSIGGEGRLLSQCRRRIGAMAQQACQHRNVEGARFHNQCEPD